MINIILLSILIILIAVYKFKTRAMYVFDAKFTTPVMWILCDGKKIFDDYFTNDDVVRKTGYYLDRKISYNEFMKYKDRVINYKIGKYEEPFVVLSFMVYKFYQIEWKVVGGEVITLEELAEFYYAIETAYKFYHDDIQDNTFTIMATHLDAYACYIKMYDTIANSDNPLLESGVVPMFHKSCYDIEWFRKMAMKYSDSIPRKNTSYIPHSHDDGVKRLLGL